MSDFSDFSSDAVRDAVGQSLGTGPTSAHTSKASPYSALFSDAGKKYGVDPRVLAGVAQTESSGNPNAVSKDSAGRPLAHGLMQLTLPTAHALGVTDPYDPGQAIDASARLLRQNLDASGGDMVNALKMYHGGTNTDNWGVKTNAYPGKVTANMPSNGNTQSTSQDVAPDFSSQAISDAVNSEFGGGSGKAVSKADAVSAVASAVAKKLILNHPAVGTGEAILNMGSSMIAKPLSDIAGLAATAHDMITGERDGNPAGFKQSVQDALTYEPRGATGKAIAEYNPISMIGKGWGLIGQEAGDAIKAGTPGAVRTGVGNAAAEAIPQAIGILGAKAGAQSQALKAQADAGPVPQALTAPTPSVSNVPAYIRKAQADFQNAKAAGGSAAPAPVESAAPEAKASLPIIPSPQIADAIKNAGSSVDPVAAARHTEASSLPVPVQLSAGQASGNIHLLSKEQNMRGAQPRLGDLFNSQNGLLVENLNSIRDAAAPDVTGANHVENGQSLIDSYKAMDAAESADISAKYKALEDANGGQFPVNGKAFVDAADAALAKKMKGRYVPPEIQADMDALRNGGPMTYENFENMRTNLAAEARKAERAGDGNRAMATSLVREALESVPIEGEAAAIKPLADAARSAAKARFDKIAKDPAYKAAVNDTTAADDFINKYVINGKVENVKSMRANLADDPLAGQTIAAGTVNFLKNRSGLVGDAGNFSQAGYNKALRAVGPKLDQLLPQEHAQNLQTLGNVARYTQEQPRGSYVNNSNTFTAKAANAAKGVAAGAANLAAKGIPVGTWTREFLAKRSDTKAADKALAPGAGIKLSDFPK